MLVVPELEREVELLWELRKTRKVFNSVFLSATIRNYIYSKRNKNGVVQLVNSSL